MDKAQQNIQDTLRVSPTHQFRKDWSALLERLSYKGIVHNIPFILYIVLLCVLYISSNQRAIDTQKELDKQKDILKELGWKYMDLKTQLMNAGMESNVIRNGADIGLKPLTLPAYKLDFETTEPLTPKP